MKKIIVSSLLVVFLISTVGISSAVSNQNNNPPTGLTIGGPSEGDVDNLYTFSASATDPDGDMLYYTFSWGDGTSSDSEGPYISGTPASVQHSWSSEGTYTVSVTVSDRNGGSAGPATTSIKIDEEESVVVSNVEGAAIPVVNPYETTVPLTTPVSNDYGVAVLDVPENYDECIGSSIGSSSSSSSSSDSSESSAESSSSSESSDDGTAANCR